jgi:hypothetical protein
MRKMYVLVVVTGLLVAGALAQSDSDYQGWMKSNAANMGSLNKNIAAKDGAGAASDAQKLEATFKQVADFWTKHGGADDAVNFAMRGQTAAAAVAKAATAGNLDEAGAQVKNLQATCGGCHMAHREGTAGSFKIK